VVNDYYWHRELTSKNILKENIIIVLTRILNENDETFILKSIPENSKFKKIIKKYNLSKEQKQKLENQFKIIFFDKAIGALYIDIQKSIIPIIVIRYDASLAIDAISMIVEYNHFLIDSNINANIKDDIIFTKFFDETITSYFSFLNEMKFFNSSIENLYYQNEEIDDIEFINKVFAVIYSEIKKNKNNLNIDLFLKLKDDRVLVEYSIFNYEFYQYFCFVICDFIISKYGLEHFYKFISFLYNGKYSSLDEVTYFINKQKFDDFCVALDKWLKNKIK